ncbi:brain-specific angiogenesis inhibitor 1-associated protein 2-like [Macrosteles quadrilineatus]|uniref:brain-specific angiogenesis inhibitor 1-associated protein 2-like n=1 Tax=Macrosteles quadrilineatus TaxID=74068 RepID=UPI0023E139D8|nr:brain-specific angiogenesis inhibitor 1-associated protein 2-like isoform X2 [Macrosteles quadrilineatus]XP_054289714.1 brain-specific angiogenesis inhibitor 1-associated protein 2-like [Macrosteles quadrilineatus]
MEATMEEVINEFYKNILDKFNPGARQMINAGKAYLKALHGAAAASRLYVEAITKLARQSQQGTWGGSSDIGAALMKMVEVYKEIQAQQMNILKAFYVDLLVPLETNLEKDTKVVQSEQKRFLQQHKQRSETYSKAAATMKKQRKKRSTKTGLAMDKELKSMQVLEEERSKLDAFCEQSLKNAMTQERRRYGFVLERQCSLAKHYLAYHTTGMNLYQAHLDNWTEVAKTREYLPESVETMFANRLRQVSFWSDDDTVHSPSRTIDDDRMSISSQLRKTKSMDASCLDVRAINDISSPTLTHHSLTRAKSDFNLTASNHSLAADHSSSPSPRPKSLAVADEHNNWDTPLARAMYAYLSSGENQLSFLEGDLIALMGDRNKGWQFGENLRTQCSGWFPLAYTEPLIDDSVTTTSSPTHRRQDSVATTPGGFSLGSPGGSSSAGNNHPPPSHPHPSTTRQFGDTLAYRQTQNRPTTDSSFSAGPPGVPAPVAPHPRSRAPPPLPPLPPHPTTLPVPRQPSGAKRNVPPANASLHSSNDSGFSNDPPPAPEVDYSDDEQRRTTTMKNQRNKQENGHVQNGKKELASVRGWLSEATNEWYTEKSSKSHRPLRQTSSVGVITTLGRKGDPETKEMALKSVEIPYEKKVKRTKSLWKFRKSEDVLEGMALWKHRSLVDVTDIAKESGTPLPGKKSLSLSKSLDDDTEDVSEETIVNGERKDVSARRGSVETSSESEMEDNESCIVVDDHLKAPKATLLPRTRLIRSATKVEPRKEEERVRRNGRTRPQNDQPWFDPWDNQ